MTDRDLKAALRLLERLANPRGDWRDKEYQRRANKLLKKINRSHERERHNQAGEEGV